MQYCTIQYNIIQHWSYDLTILHEVVKRKDMIFEWTSWREKLSSTLSEANYRLRNQFVFVLLEKPSLVLFSRPLLFLGPSPVKRTGSARFGFAAGAIAVCTYDVICIRLIHKWHPWSIAQMKSSNWCAIEVIYFMRGMNEDSILWDLSHKSLPYSIKK